jgi:glycosyltransferase involved in cell wall biosynthesis
MRRSSPRAASPKLRAMLIRRRRNGIAAKWPRPRIAWEPAFATRSPADVVSGLFSVVVPVFNGADLLERALRSVLGQTYPEFEILLVDDGSTDDSLERARCLAQGNDRISLYAMDNSGSPARPRNQAIQRSSGEFIAFLDQDDWWLPEKLERQFAKFREDDFAVVYTDSLYLDAASEESGKPMSELAYYRRRTGEMPEGFVQREIIRSNFTAQYTVAIRTDWVQRIGRLNEAAVGVDCYEYLLRLGLADAKFGVVREVLGVYDRQDSSLSRDQTTAWASSLPFFRRLSRQYPEYFDEWAPRIREYERALARVYLDQARDKRADIEVRLRSISRLLGVHPPAMYLASAARSFLPRRRQSVVRGPL